MTLSEIKATKGAFKYYIITEEEGVSKLLMHDYGTWKWGWPSDGRR